MEERLMRRTLAAAALAAGILAAAGCGGGGEDGGSTAAVCDRVEDTVEPLEPELTEALQTAALAAGQGDDAALAEAMVDLNGVVDEITTAVRDGAADADDQEFRLALENFANELETLALSVESGNFADPGSFATAADEVSGYCD
jgi:hypothetical protein